MECFLLQYVCNSSYVSKYTVFIFLLGLITEIGCGGGGGGVNGGSSGGDGDSCAIVVSLFPLEVKRILFSLFFVCCFLFGISFDEQNLSFNYVFLLHIIKSLAIALAFQIVECDNGLDTRVTMPCK